MNPPPTEFELMTMASHGVTEVTTFGQEDDSFVAIIDKMVVEDGILRISRDVQTKKPVEFIHTSIEVTP
jgi:hypothetical protein